VVFDANGTAFDGGMRSRDTVSGYSVRIKGGRMRWM